MELTKAPTIKGGKKIPQRAAKAIWCSSRGCAEMRRVAAQGRGFRKERPRSRARLFQSSPRTPGSSRVCFSKKKHVTVGKAKRHAYNSGDVWSNWKRDLFNRFGERERERKKRHGPKPDGFKGETVISI